MSAIRESQLAKAPLLFGPFVIVLNETKSVTIRLASLITIEPVAEDWDEKDSVGGTNLWLIGGKKHWTPYTIHTWHEFLHASYPNHAYAPLPDVTLPPEPAIKRRDIPMAELIG